MIRYVVADDDDSVRAVVRISAQIEGNFVLVGEAADGNQALALIRATQPDVAVVDMGMPGLRGDEVTAILEAERSPTKVIIYTGRDLPSLPSGASAVLVKDGDIDAPPGVHAAARQLRPPQLRATTKRWFRARKRAPRAGEHVSDRRECRPSPAPKSTG